MYNTTLSNSLDESQFLGHYSDLRHLHEYKPVVYKHHSTVIQTHESNYVHNPDTYVHSYRVPPKVLQYTLDTLQSTGPKVSVDPKVSIKFFGQTFDFNLKRKKSGKNSVKFGVESGILCGIPRT